MFMSYEKSASLEFRSALCAGRQHYSRTSPIADAARRRLASNVAVSRIALVDVLASAVIGRLQQRLGFLTPCRVDPELPLSNQQRLPDFQMPEIWYWVAGFRNAAEDRTRKVGAGFVQRRRDRDGGMQDKRGHRESALWPLIPHGTDVVLRDPHDLLAVFDHRPNTGQTNGVELISHPVADPADFPPWNIGAKVGGGVARLGGCFADDHQRIHDCQDDLIVRDKGFRVPTFVHCSTRSI